MGFEGCIRSDETPHPTDEEIDFIRQFAPTMSAGRELTMELTITNMMKMLKM